MSKALEDEMSKWKEEEPVDLVEISRRLLFRCGLESLFGARFIERHGLDNLYRDFFTFEVRISIDWFFIEMTRILEILEIHAPPIWGRGANDLLEMYEIDRHCTVQC